MTSDRVSTASELRVGCGLVNADRSATTDGDLRHGFVDSDEDAESFKIRAWSRCQRSDPSDVRTPVRRSRTA